MGWGWGKLRSYGFISRQFRQEMEVGKDKADVWSTVTHHTKVFQHLKTSGIKAMLTRYVGFSKFVSLFQLHFAVAFLRFGNRMF